MRHARGSWLLVGAASLAVLVGGCREPRGERSATRAADGVAADFQDGWITTKVQAKYFAERDVRGRDIDVTTDAGVVTLAGVVDNEQARQRALQLARETDGVVRVEDRLTVGTAGMAAGTQPAPQERADAQVPRTGDDRQPPASSGARAIPQAPVGTGGDASAALEREPAAPAAPPADPSVTRTPVADALQQEQRTDEGITTRIQAMFFTDDRVRARHIDVNTVDQVVTLQGAVQSDEERQHALAVARGVEGVRGVEDRLQVEGTTGPSLSGDDESGAARSATDGVDDTWITTQVQSRYYTDDLLRGTRVNVSTQRGIVTLSGEVQSDEARRRAEQLARDTKGAMRVENRVTVRSAGEQGAERPSHGYQGQPQPQPAPTGESQQAPRPQTAPPPMPPQ